MSYTSLLPFLEKTYVISKNYTVGNTGTQAGDTKDVLLRLKNMLKIMGWIVAGSGDKTGSGAMDGVDRWVTTANIIEGDTGKGSWFVLSNPTIGIQFLISIDRTNDDPTRAYFRVSGVGFTGGDADDVPTAVDQILVGGGGGISAFLLCGDGAYTSKIYYMVSWKSTDNQVTRIALVTSLAAANAILYLDLSKGRSPAPSRPASNHIWPQWVATVSQISGNDPETSKVMNFATQVNNAIHHGIHFNNAAYTDMALRMSIIHSNSNGLPLPKDFSTGDAYPAINEMSGHYPMVPVGYASITPPAQGRMADAFDLWIGSEDFQNISSYYPEDGSKTFLQIGALVFPWDGSTVPWTAPASNAVAVAGGSLNTGSTNININQKFNIGLDS